MSGAFLNLDDSSRSFIGSSSQQLDELVNNYLVYKGIIERPNPHDTIASGKSLSSDNKVGGGNKAYVRGQNFTSEYLLASVEILSYKIEMAHMQRVLMSWISGEGRLPETTAKYTQIMRKY